MLTGKSQGDKEQHHNSHEIDARTAGRHRATQPTNSDSGSLVQPLKKPNGLVKTRCSQALSAGPGIPVLLTNDRAAAGQTSLPLLSLRAQN